MKNFPKYFNPTFTHKSRRIDSKLHRNTKYEMESVDLGR